MIVDITERKLAEERLARHIEQQRMVADLGIRALADENWRALADEAVRGVSRVLGVSHVWVLELDEGTDRVTVRAAIGWPEGTVDARSAKVSEKPLARRVLQPTSWC